MNGRAVTERLLATTSLAALMLAGLSGEADAVVCTQVPSAGATFSNSAAIPCVTVTGNAVSVTNQLTGTIGGNSTAPTSGAVAVQAGNTLSGGITNSGTITGHTGGGLSVGIGVVGIVQGGITNSGNISANDKAIEVFNTAVSFGGGITNSGNLSTANTALFVAAQTFNGGIVNTGSGTIIGGGVVDTVEVTSDVFTGGITNSGTITSTGFANGVHYDGSGNATFQGGITNAGTITSGNKAMLVEGLNTFSGGIVNTAGHSITSHSCTGVLLRNVSNFSGGITNAGTIASGGFSGGVVLAAISTFSGNISNSGTITGPVGIKIGTVSLAGGAIVNSGTIQGTGGTAINLATALGPVTVQQAGGTLLGTILFSSHGDTFSGFGTLTGNLTQGIATIAPTLGGNNTLKITGNLTQAAGSNTIIEISPATAALLSVTGTASIAGGLRVVFDPGTYTNKTYNLVHAGTLVGTYGTTTLTGSTPSTGTQTITYTGTDVDLTLAGIIAAPTTVTTTTGVFGDAADLALSGFFDTTNIVFDHLDEQQFGKGSDQVKTALAGAAPMQLAMNGPLQQLAQASAQISESLARYGAWVRGVGSFFDADNQGTASGFSASGGGVIAGIDHAFGPVTLGVAGGYSGTDFKQNDGESGDIQTIRGMVYAHYRAAPQIIVDGIAGIAYDRIHTSRPIASLGSTATQSHNAWEENLAVQAGYVMPWEEFTVIPRVGMQYLHLAENRFSESGASGFNLSRGAQSVDSFQPMISITALKPFALDNGMRVTPAFKLSYSHELLNPNETLALTTPTGSLVPAAIVTPAHNVVTLGPSATLRLNDSVNLYADYKLSIGIGKSIDNVIFAGARFAW